MRLEVLAFMAGFTLCSPAAAHVQQVLQAQTPDTSALRVALQSANSQRWYVRVTSTDSSIAAGWISEIRTDHVRIGTRSVIMADVISVERRISADVELHGGLIAGAAILGLLAFQLTGYDRRLGPTVVLTVVGAGIGAGIGGLLASLDARGKDHWIDIWTKT